MHLKTLPAVFLAASVHASMAQDALPAFQDRTGHDHIELANLICDAAADHKYILLGNARHGSQAVIDAVFNDTVMTAIRACVNSDAMVVEGPAGQENDIGPILYDNKFFRGQIQDYENKLAGMEDRARLFFRNQEQQETDRIFQDFFTGMIKRDLRLIDDSPDIKRYETMEAHGLHAVFYDPGYQFTPETEASFKLLTSFYDPDRDCENAHFLYGVAATANPAQTLDSIGALLRNRRANDNQPIADAVLAHHPDGAVLFYGTGHMDGPNDMDEMLGVAQTYQIDIVENKAFMTAHRGSTAKLMDLGQRDQKPDRNYYAAEGTDEAADIAYTDLPYQPIGEAKFDQCKAGLPENLRNAFMNGAAGADLSYDDYVWTLDKNRPGLPPAVAGWLPR